MPFELAKGSDLLQSSIQHPELYYRKVIDVLLRDVGEQRKTIALLNQRIESIWKFLELDKIHS